MNPPTDSRPPTWPWATVLLTVAVLLVFLSERAFELLIYHRDKILTGQLWRLWTGHLVHFGSSHLIWDVAVFLPAGCWLETLRPRATHALYLLSPPVISVLLLLFDLQLQRYAGLSGVAIGTLLLLALVQLGDRSPQAWLWWGILLLIAVKLTLELAKGAPLLVRDFQNVRNVPLAHFGGLGCGAASWWLLGRRRTPALPLTGPG